LKEEIKRYDDLGINLFELPLGCSVKVDLDSVVYPTLDVLKPRLRNQGFEVSSRKDAEIIEAKENFEVYRKFYKLGKNTDVNPEEIAKISPTVCTVVIQAYQRYASKSETFKALIEPVYKKISESGVKVKLGKGHSIITTFQDESTAIFDFIVTKGKNTNKFLAINNDTINIVDPTLSPEDPRQVSGALSNALNDLFVVGVHEEIQIAPLIGAPNEQVKEKILKEVEKFSQRYNFKVINVPQLFSKKIILGATVFGITDKQPPLREDLVRPRMNIVVSRPFGELAPITAFVSSLLDNAVAHDLEEEGITLSDLKKAKDEAVNLISSPNIEVAKVVSEYLPSIEHKFNEDEHILLTTDVTGPGLYVFYELAVRARVTIELTCIPLLFPKISEFVTREFLMPNSTAGTNGAFAIIVSEKLVENVVNDLKLVGCKPEVVGKVSEVGKPKLIVPFEVAKYIADPKLLSLLTLKR